MRWGPGSSKSFEQLSPEDIVKGLKAKGPLDLYKKPAKEKHPPPSCFKDPRGIHWFLHAKRVLLLSLVISYFNNLTGRK